MLICIYCGHYEDNIIGFRYTIKDGTYSRKSVQCPECKMIMRKDTLLMDITVNEWARYLYYNIRLYKRDNYFEKIKWDSLKKNLNDMGIAKDFWDELKLVKEECEGISDMNFYLDKSLEISGKGKVKQIEQVKLI